MTFSLTNSILVAVTLIIFKLIIIHFNHFMQFRGNFDNGSKIRPPTVR